MATDRILHSLSVQHNAVIKGVTHAPTINTNSLSIAGHLSISQDSTIDGFGGRDFDFKDVRLQNLYVSNQIQTSELRSGVLHASNIDVTSAKIDNLQVNNAEVQSLLCVSGSLQVATIPDLTSTNVVAVNLASSDVKTVTFTTFDAFVGNSIQLGSVTIVSQVSKPVKCTIPAVELDAQFVMSEGNQTVHGVKTFHDFTVFDNPLFLPTRGGIPSELDFYECKRMEMEFESEAFLNIPKITVWLARIGQIVICVFGEFMVQGSGRQATVTSAQWIPRQFRPADTETHAIFIRDTNDIKVGQLHVKSNGIVMYGNLFSLTVSGQGPQGFQRVGMSWIVVQ